MLSLGLDKSQTAVAFLSGPFSGIFIQPVFAIWSDNCQLSYGKRRPFIAIGGFAVILSILGLAWTESLANTWPPVEESLQANKHAVGHSPSKVALANMFMFCLFAAIQPVQGGIRALIVDVCPSHQQQEANAWVSRITAVASVCGYLSAFTDLSQHFSYLGSTQFEILTILASLGLALTLLLTCVFIMEINPSTESYMDAKVDVTRTLADLWNDLLNKAGNIFEEISQISNQTKIICLGQFFAWIGWFPYLLYATT